jgi:hypothetical protein
MHELVKDYYGRQFQSSNDLKTSACCDAGAVPAWPKPLLERIHPEVRARYYGRGLHARFRMLVFDLVRKRVAQRLAELAKECPLTGAARS